MGTSAVIDDEPIILAPECESGEVIELGGIEIVLPKPPPKKEILFHDQPKKLQMWKRLSVPEELSRIRSMDEWLERPREFRDAFSGYIEKEFERRRNGVWFYNDGIPTYITGRNYMFLQWSKIDIGYPYFLQFQRKIFLHMAACELDPNCLGQLYTKCRRSGYTNIISGVYVDEGTQVKEKLLGIQSKTGSDAQENIFMRKVVPIFRSYPFFFKPIQDGTTNPRVELAFREPSKRITKKNKTALKGDALNTVINWKNTTNNAYDGEKLHFLYLDEAAKWTTPNDIREAWRIQKTCLIVGRRIIGTAFLGSTVNPMNKGGSQYKVLYEDSNPHEKSKNNRTKSGLYRLFMPAYESLEGFFDEYGNAVIDDPETPVMGIDGVLVEMGAKTYLKNEREALKADPKELNEVVRQFPFNEDEAFRDSIDGSLFNVGKIYQQISFNNDLYPDPVVKGNFIWKEKDKEVIFSPDPNGRFRVAWHPPKENRNKSFLDRGVRKPSNSELGVGGVDSYDLDATVDGRGSKGALHMYNMFSMNQPSNMFVVEYASRPDMASIFYEDVLMCAFYYGYPLLIENNKYGIARYFEKRNFDGYLMARPKHLVAHSSSTSVKTKGIPSNSQDVIQSHAHAIEKYIHHHVGIMPETAEVGKMYFNRTLEDWIGYNIANRTKYDLTISSGLALLGAQKWKPTKEPAPFKLDNFVKRHERKQWHS